MITRTGYKPYDIDEIIIRYLALVVGRVNENLPAVPGFVEQTHSVKVSTYRIKVIHGFNSGTRIKSAIKEEFSYGREEKVLRIEPGENMGITYLILKEW